MIMAIYSVAELEEQLKGIQKVADTARLCGVPIDRASALGLKSVEQHKATIERELAEARAREE